MTTRLSSDEARLRAAARQEKTRQREQLVAETEKMQQDLRNATDVKISRLREMRLAREAQQSEAAALREAERAANPPAPKRSHKAKKTAVQADEVADL